MIQDWLSLNDIEAWASCKVWDNEITRRKEEISASDLSLYYVYTMYIVGSAVGTGVLGTAVGNAVGTAVGTGLIHYTLYTL